MKARPVGRIVVMLGLTAALGAPTWAQEETKEQGQEQKRKEREERAARQEERRKAEQAERQAHRAEAEARQQQNQAARQAERAERAGQQEAQEAQIRAHKDEQRQAIQEQRHARLSEARQRQLIQEQQNRTSSYQTLLQRQERLAQRRAQELQTARRIAQYNYQQRYLDRLRQQRMALGNSYDYYNDPYYYTAPTYRYQRGGRYYETNQYGADLLKQAVNLGYEEGVRAAQADREDGYRGDYRSHYAYQDANYGYTGRYVAQSDYNYYFREGFRRGYEDGYSNSYRYGSNNNGTLGILGAVLSTILNLQNLR